MALTTLRSFHAPQAVARQAEFQAACPWPTPGVAAIPRLRGSKGQPGRADRAGIASLEDGPRPSLPRPRRRCGAHGPAPRVRPLECDRFQSDRTWKFFAEARRRPANPDSSPLSRGEVGGGSATEMLRRHGSDGDATARTAKPVNPPPDLPPSRWEERKAVSHALTL